MSFRFASVRAAEWADELGLKRPMGPPPVLLRLVAVLVLPVFLYGLVITGQKALENYQLSRQEAALREQIQQVRQENLQLQQQIQVARSDSEIERVAREQLGLVKPGEHALVVVRPGQPTGPREPVVPPPPPPPPPPAQQWWSFFFGS